MELKDKILNTVIGDVMFFDMDTLMEDMEWIVTNNIEGDVVELGCYKGNTSKILTVLIEHHNLDKRLYVYDSFEGLPAPERDKGDGYNEGELACTMNDLILNFENDQDAAKFLVEVIREWKEKTYLSCSDHIYKYEQGKEKKLLPEEKWTFRYKTPSTCGLCVRILVQQRPYELGC